MASDPSRTLPRPGLSLYANLLDPSSRTEASSGTISRAPVVFKQNFEDAREETSAVEKQHLSAATLRFQPTKRPQLATQKPKTKLNAQRAVQVPSAVASEASPPESSSAIARGPAKTTLADWTAEADENNINGLYGGEKRQRGGKKRRKKNKEEARVTQNWDDIYDPSRPNNYEDYKHSDEKILEIREWKDRLYAHRTTRRRDSESSSEAQGRYHAQTQKHDLGSGLSFAPPPSFDIPPPPIDVPDDPTGEDAYARRLGLSLHSSELNIGPTPLVQSSAPPLPRNQPPPPPPPFAESTRSAETQPKMAPEPSISKAPVRYNLPHAPPEIPSSEAELESALRTEQEDTEHSTDTAPRSLRPGQKGFAERLMSKYGWSKGSGLGASGSGITAPLRVQVEKQKKKSDSEGGGFVGPGGMGKIIGGKRKTGPGAEREGGKFGVMSEVVMLMGMVDGMDLDAELGAGDGGLMQEIGDECGEKYGRVERVFIDRSNPSAAPVFVKFTSQLSALRAVNALEGRIFNGNTITATFFETDKFERGIYD